MVRSVLTEKAAKAGRPLRLMEVCGSHSFAIARAGIRSLLPESVKLISGPGCPVCVSGEDFISRTILLARSGIKVAVFGDLMRIPSPLGTLNQESGLLVIYSPEEALDFARKNPETEIVFAAVGFEPTLSAAAALLDAAEKGDLKHFSLLCDFKNIRPVLNVLCADSQSAIDGFLLPGHVASVIGSDAFCGLPVPGVVSGFTPENIIRSIILLLDAIAENRTDVINDYPSSVTACGSPEALKLIRRCFEPADGEWRGLGVIKNGNWKLRRELAGFDAMARFPLINREMPHGDHGGCRCGDVLAGHLQPEDCPLFGKVCMPDSPVGACMVSVEGACAASYYNRTVNQ